VRNPIASMKINSVWICEGGKKRTAWIEYILIEINEKSLNLRDQKIANNIFKDQKILKYIFKDQKLPKYMYNDYYATARHSLIMKLCFSMLHVFFLWIFIHLLIIFLHQYKVGFHDAIGIYIKYCIHLQRLNLQRKCMVVKKSCHISILNGNNVMSHNYQFIIA